MDDQDALIKELKLQNKKLLRENRRLQAECDVLKDMNEKVSRTQLFFHRDNQRQLCYNNQLLKTTPYILVMVNEKLETVMASDVFFQMSDVSRDAVKEGIQLSEAFSGILLGNELTHFLAHCEDVLKSQGTDSYLLTSHTEEKERSYQVDICYYLAQNEDAKGLSIILSDMTEIVEAKKKAEYTDRAKSSFLASMSHEIRTPINAMLGMNEMILREAKEDSILEYSANIQSAGKTLLTLINSILDFSKIEEGKMEIIPVEYSTVTMINNLMISVSERAKMKGISLEADIDPTLPSELVGDDVRFSQIISNLLTNAVKYTEKGSVCLSIRGGERINGEIILQIAVKDTGIGIRKENIPKLFEIFERLDEVRNRNIEGTGLGISIVTRLLNMMGSSLKVESVYGQGSVFSFDISQGISDEAPIGNYDPKMDSALRRVGAETLHAKDSRILVVDDNEMNLKVAKNLFKLFSITPDLISSGIEALEKLRQGNSYHIIFLDHMMPKMDGVETLKLMQAEDLLRDGTPVIALTANAVNGARERYLSAGFNGYLSKPIEVSELEKLLLHFLPDELCVSAEEDREEEASDPDNVSALQSAGFDTEAGLRYAAGDQDFYIELVSEFANSSIRNLPVIREDYLSGDIQDYQIRVHALKSSSRQIGANELSDLALKQETAAKERDTDTINAGAGELLKNYEDLCVLIRKILKLEEVPVERVSVEESPIVSDAPFSRDRILSILSDTMAKIEDYESESALEILKPLSGLPDDTPVTSLPPGITYPDFTEAINGILNALSDFDIISAEDQLNALLKGTE